MSNLNRDAGACREILYRLPISRLGVRSASEDEQGKYEMNDSSLSHGRHRTDSVAAVVANL